MKKEEEQPKTGRRNSKKIILIVIAALIIVAGGTGVGVLKASEKPSFCASCHVMKTYYASWSEGQLLAKKHAEAGVTCHQCHEESIGAKMNEGVKYITGNYQTPLKKRDFGKREFCLQCHDFDKVKRATNFEESNPHDSHNGEQDCNVCHNMHRKSKVMCSQCHQFEWMQNLGEEWQ